MIYPEKTVQKSLAIPEKAILSFLKRLEDSNIQMHSVHFLYQDQLILDHYYAPFRRGQLHRMFSISKSYTAIAVALLIEEGLLSLDDNITNYFPEYCEAVHPWIQDMTIRNMLMMRTCHKSTTYKIAPEKNWVESFFITAPTHPSGAFFHYDTGSAHVLSALVEKLTGMPMLDYIKKQLAPLELSNESYMLTDPFGVSMGGSGLVAPATDLIRIGYFLLHQGNIDGKQLLSKEILSLMTANLSDTARNATHAVEAQGYGMMFWRTRNNGYMCYGMGGQFILCYPQYQFCLCTTADTQPVRGGNQFIFDALDEEILPYLQEAHKSEGETARSTHLDFFLSQLCMKPLDSHFTPSDFASHFAVDLGQALTYRLNENAQGFSDISLCFQEAAGTLSYYLHGEKCEITFGFQHLQEGRLPGYDFCSYASGAFTAVDQLRVRIEVIDSHVGSIDFEFHFFPDAIAVAMKKVEEDYYNEYQGCLYGKRISS